MVSEYRKIGMGDLAYLDFTSPAGKAVKGVGWLNVQAFGAVGDGVTDDTAAIQAAIDNTPVGGVLLLPDGPYRITNTLVYYGDWGKSISIVGTGKNADGAKGWLKWDGAVGGRMMSFQAASYSTIKNIKFDGNLKAKYGIEVRSMQTLGGAGSTGVQIRQVLVNNITGVGSIGVALGSSDIPNAQVSEIIIEGLICNGNGTSGGYETGLATWGGNGGRLTIKDSGFVALGVGCAIGGGPSSVGSSGFNKIENTGFGQNLVDITFGPSNLIIDNCGSESSEQILTGTVGANFGSVIYLGSYSAMDNAILKSKYAIDYPGHFTAIGAQFAGSAEDVTAGYRFKCDRFTAIDSFFMNTQDFIHVYDGSGNLMTGGKESYSTLGNFFKFTSLGNRGGFPGALVQLKDALPLAMHSGAMVSEVEPPLAGVTVSKNGAMQHACHKISIEKELFITNSLDANFALFVLPPKSRIIAVITDTTQAYAGLAGTIQIALGIGATADELIVLHDVKTGVVTKGLADADLGTALARATAIQGGGFLSWTANETVLLRLKSGTGAMGTGAATNLTAGKTDIYVVTERLNN